MNQEPKKPEESLPADQVKPISPDQQPVQVPPESQSQSSLPAQPAPESAQAGQAGSEQSKEPAEEKTEEPAKPSLGTILLVEDDLPMVKMYSTKLKIEGFQVEAAHDGEQGLEKVGKEKIDLVLLDLMIPKLGGMELLEKMRADEKLKKVPVVILSNLSQEQDIQRSKELGVNHFLVKSNHTPSQVVEIVKSYFPGAAGGSASPAPSPAKTEEKTAESPV
jgi:two-component system alkaline phosphatase synthesis response regulator PhoP